MNAPRLVLCSLASVIVSGSFATSAVRQRGLRIEAFRPGINLTWTTARLGGLVMQWPPSHLHGGLRATPQPPALATGQHRADHASASMR